MTVTQWVRHHAPSTRAGGAGTVVAVAQAFQKQVNAPVQEAVEAGRLPVASAAAVVSEYDKLRPMLGDLMQEPALTTLIDLAADDGPRACRKVRPFILARYGRRECCRTSRTGARRSSPSPRPGTPGRTPSSTGSPSTSRASPSSRPRSGRCPRRNPSTGSGTCGPRTGAAATRSSPWSAGPWPPGTRSGKTNKTTLLLTMDWESLRDGLGAATTLGGLDAGTHLAPETVRRLCCDGSVIPVVLGSNSEVLDWGLERRFFTPPRPNDSGCATGAVPTRAATPRRSGRTPTTSSTGQTSDPPTWTTPPCSATGTTRPCTPGATPAASSVTRTGNGSNGTSPAAPTTTCSPGVLPRSQRDPAPHPATGRRGQRHVCVLAGRVRRGPLVSGSSVRVGGVEPVLLTDRSAMHHFRHAGKTARLPRTRDLASALCRPPDPTPPQWPQACQ